MKIADGTIKRIHVNQHHIKHNAKHPDDAKPPLTVKTSQKNYKGYAVDIDGPSRLVYSPDKPLDCGARLWIETKAEVAIQ